MSTPSTVFWEDEKYLIRPAKSLDEIRPQWWSWMLSLGWDRGYYDLDTYLKPSIGCGMIILIEKASQRPVGQVAAAINENSTGWVSMFIVDEPHRGKGLGRQLFKAVEADFARNCTEFVGLDGVVQQKQTYERRRFQVADQGTVKILTRNLAPDYPLPDNLPGELIDLRAVAGEVLAQSEKQYTGFYRPQMWAHSNLFERPDTKGFALVSSGKTDSPEHLLAWALNRRCANGVRIGPVYARDTTSAKSVLIAAMRAATVQYVKKTPMPNVGLSELSETEIAEKATLVTEVWGGNAEALTAFESLGWKDSGIEYYRMWTHGKATPEQSEGGPAHSGVFAIFDAAVG